MSLKKYRVFGYNVESELQLNTQEVEFVTPDVRVGFSELSFENIPIDTPGFHFIIQPDYTKFMMANVGIFEVREGSQIKICRAESADDEILRLFLLGSGFGFLMHQNKEFPLHGSSVVLGDDCITLVGHSGAGKSSLASGFIAKGYKVLTDDVSRIEILENECHVHHSYPSQKLWRDTAEHLDVTIDTTKKINSFMDKYHVSRTEIFEKEPKRLKAVVEIVPADVLKPIVEIVTGQQALNLLITHSYRQECMDYNTDLGEHLRFCVKLMKHIKVARILRPQGQFTVNEQIDEIIRYL